MKEPGTYVEYIHLWPQSERLETAIQSGRYDYVYTMPGVKIHQPLIDKMAYAASQIMEQPLVRPTVACDMNGLKQLIVSTKTERLSAHRFNRGDTVVMFAESTID
jgi:hypothetical protein